MKSSRTHSGLLVLAAGMLLVWVNPTFAVFVPDLPDCDGDEIKDPCDADC